VEPGERVEEAAERELREETGLVAHVAAGVKVIEYVHSLTEEPAGRRNRYDPSIAQVEVTCFHVTAPDDWEPKLDWEHDGHRWCDPNEAFITVDQNPNAQGEGGICQGDSGGPHLLPGTATAIAVTTAFFSKWCWPTSRDTLLDTPSAPVPARAGTSPERGAGGVIRPRKAVPVPSRASGMPRA
jgi:hypothetical protein